MLFAMSIDAYHVLPQWAVLLLRPLAAVGGAFDRRAPTQAGILLRYIAAGAAGLLLVFFTLMARAFVKGMAIDCGCFGLGEAISAATLARDGLLVALALVLALLARRDAAKAVNRV